MAKVPVFNCDEIQESLGAYLLGELPESWRTVVEEHLAAGCPNCNGELDELLAGLSGVAAILDGPPLNPEQCIRVQRAIEQRILSPSHGNRAPQTQAGFRFLVVSIYAAAFAAGLLLAVGLIRQLVPSKSSAVVADTAPQEVQRGSDPLEKISFVSTSIPTNGHDISQSMLLLFDEQSGEAHLYFRNAPAPGPGNHYVVLADNGTRPTKPLGIIQIDDLGQGHTVISLVDKAEAASVRLELRSDSVSTSEQDAI